MIVTIYWKDGSISRYKLPTIQAGKRFIEKAKYADTMGLIIKIK